ncbi:SDR family NAD(P)-dependent oxidoreductase [Rhodohalobacter barkolensis]|uniref:Short-chain dehydrogenase n=1 Tax=Rhodohalobacter barkolensis TaxID=2053187 RepID=A0A2N0VGF0_9BACT|nr:SDR family oxidoreductase [Rhodohalobacter barkolensis]PKD43240.1 short-chain dehydrogenase [Rhodohalobacter barkolensis]
MNSPFSLASSTILITGASSGIGRACAVACSEAGARIIALGRDEERLHQTLKLLDNKKKHISYSVELTDFNQVDRMMESFEAEGIKINGIINSAGISTTLPLRAFNPEKIQTFVDVNVTAAIYLCKWITRKKMLPESGSSIVFLSSVMGSVGESGKFIYSLTKGALLAASRSLAVELASKKVRVNCISPGVVETPMTDSAVYSRNEEARGKIEALHPLGLGKPEDVAHAAVYLLSDASAWVTGTNLFVDGGYTAR